MARIFQDFETQSALDLTIVGGVKYALDTSTRALLWSWGLDADPIKLWAPDFSAELHPAVWAYIESRVSAVGECPAEVVEALKKPDTYVVGWNEPFDFKIWRQVVVPDHGWPDIALEQTLDCMAQASASNLPGSLDMAGRVLNLGQKTLGGKAIMKRFADSNQSLPGHKSVCLTDTDVEAAIAAWGLYMDYALQDTDLTRDIWNVTRPLDADEWASYWASERVNDRGLPVDVDVCAGAIKYRAEEAEFVAQEVTRLTDGVVLKPTMTKQINEWLFDRLPDDLGESMVRARDDEGYVTRLTGDKGVMTRLLEDIQITDAPPSDDVIELLEVLQFGRSSSAVKFEKMLNQEVDGRLHDSYVFNGAGQTHRYSSRGVQTHNFPRSYLENELELLDMVAAQAPIEELREHGPVSSVLAKLIRPTIVAPEGKLFVWADYSAIEARVTPWLAASRDADKTVLELFRRGDDLYTVTAGDIFHVDPVDLERRLEARDPEAKSMRQASKVACIAEGQSVLTDTGLVPIENVTIDMKVWDGQSFVSHQGSMFKGFKDVYEYDGLTATLDHIVWTEEAGQARFGEAIRRGYHCVKSGAGRAAIRVGGDHLAGAPVYETEVGRSVRSLPLHAMPAGKLHLSWQSATGEIKGVPALHEAEASSEMAGSQTDRREGAMHQPERSRVGELRRQGDRVPVQVSDRGRRVGSTSLGFGTELGDRPDRQHGSLRTGKPSLGGSATTEFQYETYENRGELGLHPERMALRLQHGAPETVRGLDARRDHQPGARRGIRGAKGVAYYRGKVAVYDIANAGPLHRFTVSDCLVHNCLALGFLGGVGAYKAMARGYGMRVTDEEGAAVVEGWRERNRWAKRFGEQIETAAFAAIKTPGSRFKAGRIAYEYYPTLMGGSLLCWLPDGRPLVYPMAKIVRVEKFGREVEAISYLNGLARNTTWRGKLLENAVQSVAAGLLRGSILRLDQEEKSAGVVFHTHDEIGAEVDEAEAWPFADRLVETMTRGYDWSEGLPLAAEIEVNYYYTKNEKAAMKRPA